MVDAILNLLSFGVGIVFTGICIYALCTWDGTECEPDPEYPEMCDACPFPCEKRNKR